ncbi:MAG: hypothetical protein IJV98_01280 [Clostridia bacterium]|nr:hypothetical protein [Clostridia bacterium]
MEFFEGLYGNAGQKAYFTSLIEEKKCSHAYILEAPAGGGKKTFALRLAAALAWASEQDADEREKKCKRILDGTSPDVRMLRREDGKKTIGVDAARDFCDSVYLTPSELDFKMYIFDEADRITPQAQNALLKIIEEPPVGVYMILLAENSLSLLTTIRSRAQRITLQTFTENELAIYARRHLPDPTREEEKLRFACRMAEGSIGRLQTLLASGDAEFSACHMAKTVVESQISKGRGNTYFDFLKSITDFVISREALDALTRYLLAAYGDLMRAKHTETGALSFFTAEEAERFTLLLPELSIIRSLEAIDAIRADTQYNTSVALSGAMLAMELWNAA